MKMLNRCIKNIKLFLFPRKQKEFSFLLTAFLGYAPKEIAPYELAMSSKAMALKDHSGKSVNNERLEFLGDCILDAIVADLLYSNFPSMNEGVLTETKSRMVKRETLDDLAVQLALPELMYRYSDKPLQGNHVYGNALEALIGAIYLDQGYEFTQQYVSDFIILKYLDLDEMVNRDENYKSQLLEWGQKNRVPIVFQLLDERLVGTNVMQFRSEVVICNEVFEIGMGSSKKESEQQAAKHSLSRLRKKEAHYIRLFMEKNEADDC